MKIEINFKTKEITLLGLVNIEELAEFFVDAMANIYDLSEWSIQPVVPEVITITPVINPSGVNITYDPPLKTTLL